MKTNLMKKEVLWLSISIGVALICMFLPGILVGFQASNHKNVIQQTYSSNYYNGKETAVVMTLYERMKLISGEWDSNWQEVDSGQVQPIEEVMEEEIAKVTSGQSGDIELSGYCYLDYQGVLEKAEQGMNTYYTAGFYPENPVSDYNNWYRPTVTLYQYSDSIFDSYTCYVWLVEFDYYDGSLKHTLLIDDTSGLILAGGIQGENYKIDTNWSEEINKRIEFSPSVRSYYRTEGLFYKSVIDVSGTTIYHPQYELWNNAYGLTENQNPGTLSNGRKEYLFSKNDNLNSYTQAVEEVRTFVDNDKYLYSLQWDNNRCWFCLLPFTVEMEQE